MEEKNSRSWKRIFGLFALLLFSFLVIAVFSIWLWNRFDEPLDAGAVQWLQHRDAMTGPDESYARLIAISYPCPALEPDCWLAAGRRWVNEAEVLNGVDRDHYILAHSDLYDIWHKKDRLESLSICRSNETGVFCPAQAPESRVEWLKTYRSRLDRFWKVIDAGPFANVLPAEDIGQNDFPSAYMLHLTTWALFQLSYLNPEEPEARRKFRDLFHFWRSVYEQPGFILAKSVSLVALRNLLQFVDRSGHRNKKFYHFKPSDADRQWLMDVDVKENFRAQLRRDFQVLANSIRQLRVAHGILATPSGTDLFMLGLISYKPRQTINILYRQYARDASDECLAEPSRCSANRPRLVRALPVWWQYLDNGYGRMLVQSLTVAGFLQSYIKQVERIDEIRQFLKDLNFK